MNEDKINGSCSMNVTNKKYLKTKFLLEELKGRDLLVDMYIEGR
jgi:succinate dehydrogenase/fumarate reductase-like Fe-S protein